MQAGKLRHPITIERSNKVKNEYGEQEQPSWFALARSRAAIDPLSGRELWNAQQVQPDITHKITMRYMPNVRITSEDRVRFGNRIFEILTPPLNTAERNRELTFMCVERV